LLKLNYFYEILTKRSEKLKKNEDFKVSVGK